MIYVYDLEFLEDGKTIEPISIGVVAEDGREYYGVFEEIAAGPLYQRIIKSPWLMANVIGQLPLTTPLTPDPQPAKANPGLTGLFAQPQGFSLDLDHAAVLPRHVIAKQLKAFFNETPDGDPIKLWAWYGAYDHVALMQLWGAMIQRPERLPMWTRDFNQLAELHGLTPEQLEEAVPQRYGQHNALEDAHRGMGMYCYLMGLR